MYPIVANQVDGVDGDASMTLRLGTRMSQLALWQTNHVAALLQQRWPQLTCELVHMVTQGDKRLDRPLPEIGGKGLFTAELEYALRRGEIDIAVHSLKDLPVENPADLILGAVLSREDTRDVLIARESWTLATLPHGAVVGTSSLRRQAQLLATRPDLVVRSIRGNVDTRLRKVMEGEYHAAVMAGAGLTRLGLTDHISEWLDPKVMLAAPGQGALGIQCRANDARVQRLLAAIHDQEAAATTSAERQLLFCLGGGCSAPIGASAQVVDGHIVLRARVSTIDGRASFEAERVGTDASTLARELADVLIAQGAQVALQRDVAPSRSLGGKRVVVTRPHREDEAKEGEAADNNLAAQLQQVGATPIVMPMIQLTPVEDDTSLTHAISQLETYAWIIFTSPNAVEYFCAQTSAKRIGMSQAQIAAVGPATRDALQKHGVSVDAMPDEFRGNEIARTLGEISGKRILLPRSAHGGRELPASLLAAGAIVDEIALYTPMAVDIQEADRLTLAAGVEVVTFASGSAVRAMANALRKDERFQDFWSQTLVACIGPSTAEAARAEGLPVHIVATEHTIQGLVAALVAYFE